MNRQSTSKKTRYDQLVDRLRDSKVIAYVLIASSVLAGLVAFLNNFQQIKKIFFPSAPMLSFRYYTLEGHSVSLFLRGKLPVELKQQVGQQYFIVKNKTWNYGHSLYERFSHQGTDKSIHFDTAPEGVDESVLLKELTQGPIMEGTTWDSRTFTSPFDLSNAWSDWSLRVNIVGDEERKRLIERGEVSSASLSFQHWLNCKDFIAMSEQNNWPFRGLYRELTSSYCPNNFAFSTAIYDECAGGWITTTTPPRLVLRIVGIQNLEKNPITVSSIHMLTNGRVNLRQEANSGKTREEMSVDYPLNGYTLRPGETAYILLKLSLVSDPPERDLKDLDLVEESTLFQEQELSSLVAQHSTITINGTTSAIGESRIEPVGLSIKRSQFINALLRGQLYARHVYVVGPEETLYSLRGPSYEVKARTDSMLTSVITEEFGGGSCPRLFVSYSRNGSSTYEGKILKGWKRPRVDGIDHKTLMKWPSALTVVEWDKETTFLRSLELVCSSKVNADRSVSLFRFEEPQTLTRGETKHVLVPAKPAEWDCDVVWLRVVGHYVPDGKTSAPP